MQVPLRSESINNGSGTRGDLAALSKIFAMEKKKDYEQLQHWSFMRIVHKFSRFNDFVCNINTKDSTINTKQYTLR